MVERGGVRVDWFEGRGGGGGGGREGIMEEGMEVELGRRRRGGEEWGRNGEDQDENDEEGRRKKVRRGMMMLRGNDDQEKDADNAEENMLELRLSLAVAISVPSPQQQQQQQQESAPPPGSFVVHQHQNNHSHNHSSSNLHHLQEQQLATSLRGRSQSPVKPLMQRPSSPIDNHRDIQSRANLTASLKHLVSQQQQQQPVKVKSVPRIPGLAGTTAIRQQPLQYGVSPVPQLHRPHPPLVRSSSSLQDGLDSGVVHFQGIGRLTPSAQPVVAAALGQVGQHRQQQQQSGHLINHNETHESLFAKGFLHHNNSQPRLSAHRIFPRTTSAGFLQQQSGKELLTQQERQQLGSLGHSITLPSSPSSRIFANSPYAPHNISAHAVNLPVTGPQLQAFLQHQSSNAVSVASHRQTQPPSSQSRVSTLGKNPSAFSVVRPSISGTAPSSIGDFPLRERSGDSHHVIVTVCDRKVKLTSDLDATSLYALCRRWVRNDVLRRDQSVQWDCAPLPRPSPAAETEISKTKPVETCNNEEEGANATQTNLPESIESMTEKDLLQHHVEHFKNVRKRFRDNRMQRITRFMPRLALLLPVSAENSRRDGDQAHP